MIPTYGDLVCAQKLADRWLIRTKIKGHDFAEWEMHHPVGMPDSYALASIRAEVGGVTHRLLEQHHNPANCTTLEFAIKANGEFYGFGHGGLSSPTLSITMDGEPLTGDACGKRLKFNQTFVTPVGMVSIKHVFTDGLSVTHIHDAKDAVAGDSYGAMCAGTGIDRIKPDGFPEIVVGAQDGTQVGNWPGINHFSMWNSARPGCVLEVNLPDGPGFPPGDWSEATTSKTFVLDLATGIRKLYMNWRSGPPTPFHGTYAFRTQYRVRT